MEVQNQKIALMAVFCYPILMDIDLEIRKALIIPINHKGQILIQDRRGYKKPDWGYFGGSIEGDETPLEAVIRETKEELDIEVTEKELKDLGISTTMWNENKITRYLFLYPTDKSVFNVLEGKAGHWLTFEEVRQKLDDKDRFDEIVLRINSAMQS